MLNQFEAIQPHVTRILKQFEVGSNYITLGGEHCEDVKLNADVIRERKLNLKIFEKYPSDCFQCTDNTRSELDYIHMVWDKITSWGIPDEQIEIYAGSRFGNIARLYKYLDKEVRDTFLCLDTTCLSNLRYFRSRTRSHFKNGWPSNTLLLLNTQPNRNPSIDYGLLAAKDILSKEIKITAIPYEARCLRRNILRELTLWTSSDCPWNLNE